MRVRATLTSLAALLIPLGILAAATGLYADPLVTRIVITLFINLTLVVGLQTFMGNTGILSFAHIGFMGVGAYASAVFSIAPQMKGMALPDLYPILKDVQLSFPAVLAIGGATAAALAAAVGYPLMRLSEAAAVITSFALLVVIHTVTVHWSAVTNGPRTLFGVPPLTDLAIAAAVGCGAVVVAYLFKESRVGLALRATRDDPVAAAAIGIHLPFVRWVAFVVSALLAGLGGVVWAHFITSFSPSAFYLKETFVILGMLVIGGPLTVTGAVVGTVAVTLCFEGLRATENAINMAQVLPTPLVGLTELALAVAMILVLILRPGGLVGRREIGDWGR
ncbi:MAG: branched-chain amino acid ABC transporter permease [Gammaproteobacteria bacterium]|jgi:branched-chain amino acid transport system permease protein|nr:branched-chain amino acid ABC transporter permease [Gammaproteobacteria bacterium]